MACPFYLVVAGEGPVSLDGVFVASVPEKVFLDTLVFKGLQLGMNLFHTVVEIPIIEILEPGPKYHRRLSLFHAIQILSGTTVYYLVGVPVLWPGEISIV